MVEGEGHPMSDEPLRVKVAKDLAKYHRVGPNVWRYDGTHAAGNEMLATVNVVMSSLMRHGWDCLAERDEQIAALGMRDTR